MKSPLFFGGSMFHFKHIKTIEWRQTGFQQFCIVQFLDREFDLLSSWWSQSLMMMVLGLGQAQHWGLLLYLMTIVLSYHQHHQQVSKTNRPSKLRSALTEHQRDFYLNTGLMMPAPWCWSIFDKVTKSCGIDMSRSASMIRDHYQDLAIAKWCCN